MADIALSVVSLSCSEYGLIYEDSNVFINDFTTSPLSSGTTALDIGMIETITRKPQADKYRLGIG